MAYFAELDSGNIVQRVVVLDDQSILDENGAISEQLGVALLTAVYGETTNWKLTDKDGIFRKNYASIGSEYSYTFDGFIPLMPTGGGNWVLNETTLRWELVEEPLP